MTTAKVYEMRERARKNSPPRRVATPKVHEPKAQPESGSAELVCARFIACPACGSAAEDGERLRDHPFRGCACFWCGACHDSDGRGGWSMMERRVFAHDPPKHKTVRSAFEAQPLLSGYAMREYKP